MMRTTYSILALLIIVYLNACAKEGPQIKNVDLKGNWNGTDQALQVGRCIWTGWRGQDHVRVISTTFSVNGASVTANLFRVVGKGSTLSELTGSVTGNRISLIETNSVRCDSVLTSYTSHYQGTLEGDTLTLVSQDTLCPKGNCIFKKVLKLTREQ